MALRAKNRRNRIWNFIFQSKIRKGVLVFIGMSTLLHFYYRPSLRPKTSWGSQPQEVPLVGSAENREKFLDNVALSRFLPSIRPIKKKGPPVRSCHILRPTLSQIQFSNKHWQVLKEVEVDGPKMSLYLYGAYVDTREGNPLIRILLMAEIHFENTGHPKFCHFWPAKQEDNVQPVITPVLKVNYIWKDELDRWGTMHPYMLTCKSPSSKWTNYRWESVSLAVKKCQNSTNDLRLIYDLPPDPNKEISEFAVCAKALNFHEVDNSLRIVEWIEMLRILGVSNIHFDIFNVHPNVTKVLKYYEKEGVVTSNNVSLPGDQPTSSVLLYQFMKKNSGKALKHELLMYNDCFLRNMYKYKYIAVLDTDEIILPVEGETWNEILEDLHEDTWIRASSLCFSSLIFINSIKDPVTDQVLTINRTAPDTSIPFMMRRTYFINGQVQSGEKKCIHRTNELLLVSDDGPRVCLNDQDAINPTCFEVLNPADTGFVHSHPKKCCKKPVYFFSAEGLTFPEKELEMELNETFRSDTTILFYQKKLIERSRNVQTVVFP